MCGIAGFVGELNEPERFLGESNSCLSHRGPDDSGTFLTSWAGLAHTRLALIGTKGSGHQPISNDRYCISFNGEIYNWDELAKELAPHGYIQKSNSDTETLINAISHWGLKESIKKIRGIFAIAVLDQRERRLHLIRDQSGTKPLYYLRRNKAVHFASEIKVFRSFGLTISDQALEEYLSFQNFMGDNTLFSEVKLVLPGSIVSFNSSDLMPNQEIWEEGTFESGPPMSLDAGLEEFDFLLKRAVGRNLVADFPVGSFLSSGIDSSTLAMYIHEINPGTNFYTLGFDSSHATPLEMNFDERSATSDFANLFRMNHQISEVGPGAMEQVFDQLCWAVEEPRVGQSYPNLFAAKLARQSSKAAISGAGGDELFGGYPWRYQETLSLASSGKEAQLNSYLQKWHRLGSFSEISNLVSTNESRHTSLAKEKVRLHLDQNSQSAKYYELSDLLYFEYKTFLQGLLLVDDKIAMSQGLEIRVPFLDQDLVRFAQKLPNDFRVGRINKLDMSVDENILTSIPKDAAEGKRILRLLAAKMGNPLATAPKRGFSGPDASWFKNQSQEFVRNRILNVNSPIWSKLNYNTGSALIESHLNGETNRRLLIWSLLSLDSIFRQFL